MLNRFYILFIQVIFLGYSSFGFSQELVEKTFVGQSAEKSATAARKDIIDRAQSSVAEEFAKEFLGEEKFLKNRAQIISLLNKSAGQFIPYSKPGNLEKINDEFQMSVQLKVNPQLLGKLLQDGGFVSQSNIEAAILPLVNFVDSKNEWAYRWWVDDMNKENLNVLINLSRSFENQLQLGLRKSQFFSLRPTSQNLILSVPRGLRSENLNVDSQKALAAWFLTPYYLDGTVQLKPSAAGDSKFSIDVKFSLKLVQTGAVVADVVRLYETDRGSIEQVVQKKWKEILPNLTSDLISQVAEASTKGSLGAKIIKLLVSPKPTAVEQEKLKEMIRSSGAGIRGINERLISSDQILFEMTSQANSADVVAKLKKLNFVGVTLEVSAESEDEIMIKWQRQRGGQK